MNKFLIISLLCIASCNTTETKNADNKKDSGVNKTNEVASLLQGCYIMTEKKDTATIQLTINGSIVSGKLNYNLFMKDRNTGEINGVVADSLFILNYTFRSEGMNSVREVVFKIKGNELFEGFGDIIEEKNGVSFKDITKLRYNTIPFVKVSCK